MLILSSVHCHVIFEQAFANEKEPAPFPSVTKIKLHPQRMIPGTGHM